MKHQTAWMAAGVVGASGVAAWSQYAPDQDNQRSHSRSSEQQPLRGSSAQQADIGRMSVLLGSDIETRNGDTIGDIENFAVDLNQSRAVYVIVDADADVGARNDLIAIPFSSFQFERATGGNQPVILNVDRQQLRNSMSFSRNEWPNFTVSTQEQWRQRDDSSREWRDRHDWRDGQDWRDHDQGDTNYPSTTGNPGGAAAGDTDEDSDRLGHSDRDDSNYPGASGNIQGGASGRTNTTVQHSGSQRSTTIRHSSMVKATDLIGMDIESSRNQDLGEIEDVMVNLSTGDVPFAVLSTGGFIGMGEQLHAVPLQAFRSGGAGGSRVLVLDIDAERLRNAPTFDNDRWPTRLDPQFSQRVYAFYNVQEPDWVYGFSGGERDRDRDRGGAQQMGGARGDLNATISNWPQASQRAARDMVQKYGQPDIVTPSMIKWEDNGPWYCTVVFQEELQHNFPTPHADVLQQSIYYKVPPDMVDDLARFDGSIIVDRTKGTMCARCDQEAGNYLALNLAHEIVTGKRSVDEARQFLARTISEHKQGQSSEYTQRLMFSPSSGNTGDPDTSMGGRDSMSGSERDQDRDRNRDRNYDR